MSKTYPNWRTYLKTVAKHGLFSIPHYFHELRELRSFREFNVWLYYKYPYAFPLTSMPPYVTIELTNACNFECGTCWRSIMDRPVGYMELGLFKKIISELNHVRPVLLKVGGTGELSLHPKLDDLMAALGDYQGGGRVFLYSNGSLFSRVPHDTILGWNIDALCIGVDGTDAETYRRLRVGGNYELLETSLRAFVETRNRLGRKYPKIELRHIVMPDESPIQLAKFRNHWIKVADTVKFHGLIPLTPSKVVRKTPCRLVKRDFSIEWDGRVRVCSFIPEYLGDLNSSTVQELWLSPQFNFLRDRHQRLDFTRIPECRKCL